MPSLHRSELGAAWEHMIEIADQGSKCSKFAVGLDGTSRISSSQKSVEKIICGGSPWVRTVPCFPRRDPEFLARPGLPGPPHSCVSRRIAGMSKGGSLSFRMDFREIHRHPVKETSDFGQHVHLIPVSVLAQHEVSTMGVVADETIGLRTAIRGRLSCVIPVIQEAPIQPHFQKMFVTKRAKVFARLSSRHIPSSRTPPNVLLPDTVSQWNTLGPLGFGVVPQYVNSYASDLRLSRVYSLKVHAGLASS